MWPPCGVARKVTQGHEAQKLRVYVRAAERTAYAQQVHTPLSSFEHITEQKKK